MSLILLLGGGSFLDPSSSFEDAAAASLSALKLIRNSEIVSRTSFLTDAARFAGTGTSSPFFIVMMSLLLLSTRKAVTT